MAAFWLDRGRHRSRHAQPAKKNQQEEAFKKNETGSFKCLCNHMNAVEFGKSKTSNESRSEERQITDESLLSLLNKVATPP